MFIDLKRKRYFQTTTLLVLSFIFVQYVNISLPNSTANSPSSNCTSYIPVSAPLSNGLLDEITVLTSNSGSFKQGQLAFSEAYINGNRQTCVSILIQYLTGSTIDSVAVENFKSLRLAMALGYKVSLSSSNISYDTSRVTITK